MPDELHKFPAACPVCKGPITRHEPETDDDYEWAGYLCGAELVLNEHGKFSVNENCKDALETSVKKLNAT